ncbi:uncharacterized protein [Cherax quadricarinatus]|uniref:uncharacterized protein isoform X1 n=1 Tax=Cherax quadricarinatus TaxID=27406 RepID=UPI00387ECDD7
MVVLTEMMTWWKVALVAVTTVVCMVSKASGDINETIKDIYENPSKGEVAIPFSYDPASTSFNTTISFTCPIFSFTLPGAGDFSPAGISLQSFGGLTFIGIFLLGGLAIAIYTTNQKATGPAREISDGYSLGEYLLNGLITESLTVMPIIVDKNCVKQAICEAYVDSKRFGFLTLPVRLLVPSPGLDVPEEKLTELQKAARYAEEGGEDCHYEFPCLLQPLDLILFFYDYLRGHK